MTSPARQLRQRKRAANATANPMTRRAADKEYDLMLAALWEARQRLKNIKSVERKVEAKREILPQFDAYVSGVLEADTGAPDDVLMNVMVWRFDIGDLAGGLAIGAYAMRHGLDTPDRYQRDTASIIAEQVAEETLAALEADAPDLDSLADSVNRAVALTDDADIHDQIRAKLYKAAGYGARAAGSPKTALAHLQRALALNGRAGVKKDIEKLEREIAKQHKDADDPAGA
jgi:hypothetical protein